MTERMMNHLLAGLFLNAAIVGMALFRLGVSPTALSSMWFCLVLVVCALTDLHEGLILNVVTYPGMLLALVFAPWTPSGCLKNALMGALVVGGGMLLVAVVFRLVQGVDGLGMGDVKLAAMMGSFLGWAPATLAVAMGSMTAAMFGFVAMMLDRPSRTLPFAPFLALGGIALTMTNGGSMFMMPI